VRAHRFREMLDHILRDDDFARCRGLRTRKSLFCKITLILEGLDAISEDIVKLSDTVLDHRVQATQFLLCSLNLVS